MADAGLFLDHGAQTESYTRTFELTSVVDIVTIATKNVLIKNVCDSRTHICPPIAALFFLHAEANR